MPNQVLIELAEQLTQQANIGRLSTPAFGSEGMPELIRACLVELAEEDFQRILDHSPRDSDGLIQYLIETVEGQISRVLERERNQDIAEPIVKPGRDILATLTEIRAVMQNLREEQVDRPQM